MVNHPDLIRQITIKEFDHFMNHRNAFNAGDDKNLFGDSVFSMKDQKWKDMRSTLSPAFTGSKMRSMFELIRETAEASVKFLQQEKGNKPILDIELKDFFRRYANDVIATTAFGFKIDSMTDRDNEFFKMGQEVTTFGTVASMKFFLINNFRTLSKFLKLSFFTKRQTKYYMNMVLGAMKHRFDNKIHRPDMVNMMMETRGMFLDNAHNKPLKEWTDSEIVAQCFVFFFAGFESSSNALCFTVHELIENLAIQEKLKQEVMEVAEKLNGKPLSYEALNSMKYMDTVVAEALRKWPLAANTDRICTKDVEIQDPETGETILIKAGETVMIPIVGLQRDPEYYPNPLKFDPDRFSDENKHNIKPNTYLPFGCGPRICIGQRFKSIDSLRFCLYTI